MGLPGDGLSLDPIRQLIKASKLGCALQESQRECERPSRLRHLMGRVYWREGAAKQGEFQDSLLGDE